MGVDVSWKFVQQSRASFPHLKFERIDVLEDTAFVTGLPASPKECEREAGGREGSSSRPLWAWVDIGGIRELSGLVRLLPIVIDQVIFLCLLPRSAAFGGRRKPVLPLCCAMTCLGTLCSGSLTSFLHLAAGGVSVRREIRAPVRRG